MEKYYLIPVTEYYIYIGDKTLRDILKNRYEELVQKEEERINILYSTSPVVKMPYSVQVKYNKHNEETSKRYEELCVPQYLIAYKKGRRIREISTDTILFAKHSCHFDIREVSKEKALNYFENVHVTQAGGVIASHCGPGTLGVLYVAK